MATFFADDPVDATADAPDVLGRAVFASHLTELLDRVSQQSPSSVLALIGPWGSGKSSVLSMTIRQLSEMDGWQVAEFNPWGYADLDAMLVGFFEEVSAALPEEIVPTEIRRRLGRFVQRLSPAGRLGGFVGSDAEGAVDLIGRLIAGDQSATQERRRLADLLDQTGQLILVVLDDLDRLAPAELLLVFKLVRFLGRLPHVYYLLSYDERTLLDVLAQTELCASTDGAVSARRARDYLEKIVQVRLDLPPMREIQAAQMLTNGIDDLVHSLAVTEPADGRTRFLHVYEVCMRAALTTPRSINRYLAQVDALYTILGEEVDFYDFAILTFLRTFEPHAYSMLFLQRSSLAVDRPGRSTTDLLAVWRDLLVGAKIATPDVPAFLSLLGELFLPIGTALANQHDYGSSAVAELANRRAIGHRDYCDRYFTFGVPDDDLSDLYLSNLLSRLAVAGHDDGHIQQLRSWLLADPTRALRKMTTLRPREPEAAEALVLFLGRWYDDLGEGPGRRAAELLVLQILEDHEQDRAYAVLTQMPSTLGGALLELRVVQHLGGSPDVSPGVASQLARLTSMAFHDLPPDGRALVRAWSDVDPAACQRFLRETVEAGHWDPLDIVGSAISFRTEGSRRIPDRVDEQLIERYLGIAYLVGLPLAADKVGDLHDRDRTLDDRRAAALRAIDLLRA